MSETENDQGAWIREKRKEQEGSTGEWGAPPNSPCQALPEHVHQAGHFGHKQQKVVLARLGRGNGMVGRACRCNG